MAGIVNDPIKGLLAETVFGTTPGIRTEAILLVIVAMRAELNVAAKQSLSEEMCWQDSFSLPAF